MFPLVESETVKWVLEEADDGILITNSDMAEKAKEIAADQNIPNFKASPGWITKTKRKNRALAAKNDPYCAKDRVFRRRFGKETSNEIPYVD